MNLTNNFTLGELTASDFAIRHGINNVPQDAEILENLQLLAQGLERVRAVLNKPVLVNSGYRCPKLNSSIGGAKSSYHLKGLAADIRVPGMSPRDVCRVLEQHQDTIQFRTLIYEGTWTHIDFPDTDESAAGRVLTAIFKDAGVRYVSGIA